jgi:rhamnose utilization protein RhaD (predicted bifunctional aldolase and dehydrogenase)
MVWGMIWKGGRSDLVIMERDLDSKKQGYSSRSYIWALEEGLLPYYRPGYFFQQDNAKIHKSKLTKDWLERHGIWVIDHPTQSPDLNPIEHVWKKMKEILRKDYPYLYLLKDNKENRLRVAEAIMEAWWRVP